MTIRKISIKAVAIFLTLTLILSGIGYSLLNNNKTSASPATPVVRAELNDDQNNRLNLALAEAKAAQDNSDKVILQIFSEAKQNYQESEFQPVSHGKWRIVGKQTKPEAKPSPTPSPQGK